MKVGDLVKFKNENSNYHVYGLGIVVEPYDTPKGMWVVHWFDNGETNPFREVWLEVVSE